LKEYSVILETTAVLDMRGILNYITDIIKQPETAARIFFSIEEKVKSLNLMPTRHSVVRDEPYATLGVRMMPAENYIAFFIIDEEKAPYVVKIYEMYIERISMVDIAEYLNKLGIRNARGNKFTVDDIKRILTNRKYIGMYSYDGVETPGGIPRIVSDELFQMVQDELARNSLAPGRNRAKTEYLLTTKLYCGECKSKMTGKSGTSKSGKLHTYYKCVSADNKEADLCSNKSLLPQEDIENFVVLQAQRFINYTNINEVASEVARLSKDKQDNTQVKLLEKSLTEVENKKERALKTLLGNDVDDTVRKVLIGEISKSEELKVQYEQELLIEKSKHEVISARELKYFFKKLGAGNVADQKYRKMLVNTLINRVYLYYNKVAIVINIGGVEKEIEISLIEGNLECSPFGVYALPILNEHRIYWFIGFVLIEASR